jgi:hypothetical protein
MTISAAGIDAGVTVVAPAQSAGRQNSVAAEMVSLPFSFGGVRDSAATT